jgi:hypothetical protein
MNKVRGHEAVQSGGLVGAKFKYQWNAHNYLDSLCPISIQTKLRISAKLLLPSHAHLATLSR